MAGSSNAKDLPRLTTTRANAERQIEARLVKGEKLYELLGARVLSDRDVNRLAREYLDWDDGTSVALEGLFDKQTHYALPTRSVYHTDFPGRTRDLKEDVETKISRLRSILDRVSLCLYEETLAPGTWPKIRSKTSDVFVVHGHDEGAKASVARFI